MSNLLRPLASSPLDANVFRAAMRHLVGGVSVITVGNGQDRGGLTVTSVTSFSADPPSLLVCIRQSASGMALLRSHMRFGVSVLGADHQEIADRFSGRDGSKGADRFRGADWVGRPDCPPVFAHAIASFECDVEEIIERFSHTIIIGRVQEVRAPGGADALVYWRAQYGRMEQPASSLD